MRIGLLAILREEAQALPRFSDCLKLWRQEIALVQCGTFQREMPAFLLQDLDHSASMWFEYAIMWLPSLNLDLDGV